MAPNIDRRALLKLLGASAIGLTSVGAVRTPADAAAGRPAARAVDRKPKFAAVDPNALYQAPFELTGTPTLSDSYLYTNEILLEPDDRLATFARSDGTVEALILTAATQTVSHLRPDPSLPGGWDYYQLGPYGSIVDFAVALDEPTGNVYLAMHCSGVPVPSGSGPAVIAAILPDGGQDWSYQSFVFDPAPDGPLHTVVDIQTRQIAFSSVARTAALNADGSTRYPHGMFFLYQPAPAGEQWGTAAIGPLLDQNGIDNPTYTDGWITAQDGAILDWIYLGPDGSTAWFVAHRPAYNFTDIGGALNSTVLYWGDGYIVAGVDQGTKVIFWDTDITENWASVSYWGLEGIAADTFVRRIGTNGQLEYYGLINDAVGAIPYDPSTLNEPLGLVPFEANMSDFCGAVTGNPLAFFGVDSAGLVRYLARDATTQAWTNRAVLQPNPQLQRQIQWTVTCICTDAGALPVSGAELTVTTDRVTAIYQGAQVTELQAGQSVQVTTDDFGHLSLAMPATGLHGPVLTITGSQLAAPVTVTTNAPVTDYLAGNGSLNSLAALTGEVLMQAQDSSGQPLFPTLATGSSDAAQATAGLINAVATMGLAASAGPGSGDPTSWSLSVQAGIPTVTTGSQLSTVHHRLGSAWSDFESDVQSGLRALETGAATVTTAAVSWAQNEADQAKSWLVSLTAEVVGLGEQVLNWTINTIDDAVAFLEGLWLALKADLGEVVNWLTRELTALFKPAVTLADNYYQWLLTLQPWLVSQTATYKTLGDNTFASLRDDMSAYWKGRVEPEFQNGIFSSIDPPQALQAKPPKRSKKAPKPKPIRTGATGLGSVAQINFQQSVMGDSRFRWLWDRVIAALSELSAESVQSSPPSNVLDFVEQLTQQASATNFKDDLSDAWGKVVAIFDNLIDSRSATQDSNTTLFLEAILDLALAGVDLLDVVFDAFMILAGDLIAAGFDSLLKDLSQDVPLLADLFSLIGVSTCTPGYLTCLVVAVACLVYAEQNDPTLLPTLLSVPSPDPAGLRDDQYDWGPILAMGSGLSSFLSGALTFVTDVETFKNIGNASFKSSVPIAVGQGLVDTFNTFINLPSQSFTKSGGGTGYKPPLVGGVPDFSGAASYGWLSPNTPAILGLAAFAPVAVEYFQFSYGDGIEAKFGDLGNGAVSALYVVTGAILTVFDSIYAWAADQDDNLKTEAVAGNMTYVFDFLTQDPVIEATEGWSVVGKIVLDIGATVTVGLAAAEEADDN